ncbi:phosphonatase-like hydrolase [Nocardia sp. NPDC050717]|uniref:phosphonatase-like hydrolase n=1 Tax=Nocardia sp. NPDC050717 TaxID=3157221 RepID=UPI0033DDB6EA
MELVVLDMAGTTVTDGGSVVAAFDVAATAVGLPTEGPERASARRYVLETMGQSKITVFRALFGARAEEANAAFERAYDERISAGVTPIPGATEALAQLRAQGLRVVLTTGFSAATQQRLLDALGWHQLVDLALAPTADVRGRPFPDLVFTAVMRTGAAGVGGVVVVGDTAGDMESGCRAGAATVVGVRTGAHDAQTLRAAGATHILPSVADLPALLSR